MYAIQARQALQRIDVTMDGVLDARELVRCISQASALAEAGSIRRVCADLSNAEPCGLDHGLIVAALRSRATINIRVAVIAAQRAARISQRILTRSGLSEDQAQVFAARDEAEAWLGIGRRGTELAATDRRHVDLAATLLTGAKGKQEEKAPRTSVA